MLTLNEVLDSKIYVKENSAVKFLEPTEYINPFINKLSEFTTSDIKVKTSEQIINQNPDGTNNISYARVNVEVLGSTPILLEDGTKHMTMNQIIGMVYALDVAKPIIKVYAGTEVSACTNLMIFNAESLYQQDLTGNFRSVFQQVEKMVADFEEKTNEIIAVIKSLQKTNLTNNEMNEYIGKLLREVGKTKVGTTPILKATRMLDDKESIYYVGDGNNFNCNKFNLFNAITHSISNSNDILDKPTKTIQLAKLILN